MNVHSRVKELLVDVLALEVDPSDIGNEDMLFEGALGLDSVSTIEILTCIEDEFGMQISDDEISLELFQTVNSLASLVQKHVDG